MKPGLLLLSCLFASTVWSQCSPSGPRSGTSFYNSAVSGSTVSWTNPGNAKIYDGIPAVASVNIGLLSNATTDYLSATGFNFSIPPTAMICGIKVDIQKSYNVILGLLSNVLDNSVMIIKGGSITGTNKASDNVWLPFDALSGYTTYGSSSDLWGLAWTPADVNASDFGIAVSATVTSGLAALSLDALVDHVRITVFYTITTLPVTFKDFWGKAEPGQIKLNWSTASESNSSHFILEKMLIDGTGWRSVDSLPAAVNSVTDRHYSSYDHFPAEKNIYRVRQVDQDGRYLYSKTISVKYQADGKAVVSVYPNPASRFISVEASQPLHAVRLLDIAGREMTVLQPASSVNALKIPVDHFGAGVYFLVTETGDERSVQRVVINR